MATERPYTGARSRASKNDAGGVPPQNNQIETLHAVRTMQVAAAEIDAMTLGVELMIQNQRRIMQQENVGSFMLDNELWTGMATLLSMVRHHALDIATNGETVEKAAMQANQGVPA